MDLLTIELSAQGRRDVPVCIYYLKYLFERLYVGESPRESGQTWPVGPARNYWISWTAAGHMMPYACLARIGWLHVIGDLPAPSANCSAERETIEANQAETLSTFLQSVYANVCYKGNTRRLRRNAFLLLQ
jgi:hypothetical protein